MLRRITSAMFGLMGVDPPARPPVWPAICLLSAIAGYLVWCCFG